MLFSDLTGDARWREARRAEYVERIEGLERIARTPERDLVLAAKVEVEVEALPADAVGS